MKTHKKYSFLLVILIWGICCFVGCKPEELPDKIEDTPDFYLVGTMENQPLDIAGGVDDYYMYTSYERDDKNVINFRGNLAKVNCRDCSGALQIEIRDIQQTEEGAMVNPSQSFRQGSYNFRYLKQEKKVFRVAFQVEDVSSTGNTFMWDFGDGNVSSESNPIHEFIGIEDKYEVCLEVISANNESTSICNHVSLKQDHCLADFTHELRPEYGNYVVFRSESRGIEPIRYLWDFGDGTQATLNNPGYYYPDDSIYTACLTIVDEHGCVSTLCKNITTEPGVPEGNFSYEIQSATIPRDTLSLSRVAVQWVDSDGTLYSSAKEPQPTFSHFEILETEDYKVNEKGESTQRLKIRFGCRVFANGKFIDLRDVEGYIGVAYP